MKPRLLLIDDEPRVTDSLKRTLKDEGYEILTATSAGEGLKILQEEECAVVVSDNMMGNMSGSEVMKYINEEHPATVCILLTGKPTLEAAMEAINDGNVFKLLEKPMLPTAMLLTVREAMDFHRIKKAGIEATKAEEPDVVLVADEDDQSRATLKTMLEAEGYVVRDACDAAEANFQLQTGEINCVAMNLKLEGDEGLDMIRNLAETKGGIPTVLVSAPGRIFRESAEEIHKTLTYMQEPVELAEEVKEVLARLDQPAEVAAD